MKNEFGNFSRAKSGKCARISNTNINQTGKGPKIRVGLAQKIVTDRGS